MQCKVENFLSAGEICFNQSEAQPSSGKRYVTSMAFLEFLFLRHTPVCGELKCSSGEANCGLISQAKSALHLTS